MPSEQYLPIACCDAALGDDLGQPLQQLGKAVEAVVARAERIQVGADARI